MKKIFTIMLLMICSSILGAQEVSTVFSAGKNGESLAYERIAFMSVPAARIKKALR